MSSDDATDLLFSLRGRERWREPWSDYRRLRDDDPVHHVDHPEYGEFVVLSRFEDVFDAARDTETFSSAGGLSLEPHDMASFAGRAAPIVMTDPPAHTAMRRRVNRPMGPRAVVGLDGGIRAFVDRCLDEIEERGGQVDIVEQLFKPLPSFIVATYLGVPLGDRARFDAWTNAIVAANASGAFAHAADAFSELFSYAHGLMAYRRDHPGEDLISELVVSGGGEDDALWIVGFVFTMVTGGNDTTTGLLGGAAELLTARPLQREILLEDLSRTRSAVDELLRLTTPVQNLARTTTHAVTRRGRRIPEGRKVLLLFGAANRDEREFGPSVEDLDVRRRVRRMLSFGYGPHHCLGAPVARSASTIALEGLLRRFPRFEVDTAAGSFAPGPYVRRYESLPFSAWGT